MYIDFHPLEERFDKFSGIQSKIETSFAELGIHFFHPNNARKMTQHIQA